MNNIATGSRGLPLHDQRLTADTRLQFNLIVQSGQLAILAPETVSEEAERSLTLGLWDHSVQNGNWRINVDEKRSGKDPQGVLFVRARHMQTEYLQSVAYFYEDRGLTLTSGNCEIFCPPTAGERPAERVSSREIYEFLQGRSTPGALGDDERMLLLRSINPSGVFRLTVGKDFQGLTVAVDIDFECRYSVNSAING